MSLAVSIKNFLLGNGILTLDSAQSELLVNICMEAHIPYKIKAFDEKSITVSLSLYYAKKLISALSTQGCEYEFTAKGLPIFFAKYKKRPGIIIGALLIFFLVFLSSMVVWDVRVSGNTTLTDAEILDALELQGFGIGSLIHARDVDEITNKVILSEEKIAWMSINFNGTVAYVQVREHVRKQASENMSTPSNLIAKCDGIIEYAEVMRGTCAVKEGDGVKEGDLLISGVAENKNGNYRLEHALGKVFATTNHSFSIKIPLDYTENILLSSVCLSKTVKFFDKSINIFRKGGNLGATCVKIEEENELSIPGMPSLPISIVSENAREYRTASRRLSSTEASDLAFFELNNLIYTTLSDADILSKTVKTEISDDFFLLECKLVCSENIAISNPISNEK